MIGARPVLNRHVVAGSPLQEVWRARGFSQFERGKPKSSSLEDQDLLTLRGEPGGGDCSTEPGPDDNCIECHRPVPFSESFLDVFLAAAAGEILQRSSFLS